MMLLYQIDNDENSSAMSLYRQGYMRDITIFQYNDDITDIMLWQQFISI